MKKAFSKKYVGLYIFIALITVLNAWYASTRKSPEYKVANGALILSMVPAEGDTSHCVLTYGYMIGARPYSDTVVITRSFLAFSDYFIGHSFPVAYVKDNPRKNYLCMYPEQFRALKMAYPDSLQHFFDNIHPGLLM